MVVVFEPVIWDDGAAGYRSEDIVAVTDTGWVKLSGSTYDPYGVPHMSPVPRDRGLLVGTMGLEDDARVDFTGSGQQRRARCWPAWRRHGIDALVLGGVGNVRYVTGARQLGGQACCRSHRWPW